MEPEKIAIFIPIIAILSGVSMIIFMRHYENSERMAMIDKGMNPYQDRPRKRNNPSVTLRFALLAIGCGIGILLGNSLSISAHVSEEAAIFSMLLIFGGLGLLASYLVELRMSKKDLTATEGEEKTSRRINQSV